MTTSHRGFTEMVGERIRLARKAAKLTQEELAEQMGFKDRQILSNIEGGTRKVAADELMHLMELLGRPMEWFTDPYLIPEPDVISWRARRDSVQLGAYETKARNLVSAFRRFHDILGIKLNPVAPKLELTRRNSFEDAWAAAEGLVEQWQLGEIPVSKLEAVLSGLNVHVLSVDAEPDISGAACHLPQLNVILVNRQEPPARRHFTVVHESFHLITWDVLPPGPVDREYDDPSKAPRTEQLADNFASALLMPHAPIAKRWQARGNAEIHGWILEIAEQFGVSGTALYYRLRNLGLLTEGMVVEAGIDLGRLVRHEQFDPPPLYSEAFAEVLRQVLDRGLVSVRKAAGLLDSTIEDLEDLFTQYNMQVPFAL